MSWSLGLEHGDLALGNASLGTITNEAKLIQDIKAQILEQMGNDTMHPEYGSILDGGIKPNGVIDPGVIGENGWPLTFMKIQSEIGRILKDIQNRQLTRAKNDKMFFGKATLTPGEVLLDAGVDLNRDNDAINIHITIRSGAGNESQITFPINVNL